MTDTPKQPATDFQRIANDLLPRRWPDAKPGDVRRLTWFRRTATRNLSDWQGWFRFDGAAWWPQ